MEYNKLIFVAQTGTCREAMAAGIMGDFTLRHPLEILSRGLVVQFQEPMNQKAEAVLISNGINMENYVSQQLTEEDRSDRRCPCHYHGRNSPGAHFRAV